MQDKIITIRKPAQTEIMVKKSRFIVSALPVEHEQEALNFIKQVKKEHNQANHNVYAYLIDEHAQRYSDDGEPGGTAGKPAIDVIKHQGLSGIALVITRYFGGILLGAGGLARAYADAAVRGIEVAGIYERLLYQELKISIDYHWLGLIKHELENSGGQQIDIKYGQRVNMQVYLRPKTLELVVKRIIDKTAAQVVVEKGQCIYL